MKINNTEPLRIISLVPSISELLAYLGLDEEVIGITKFCVHPQNWFKNKARIGGTKNINIQKIITLQPTLVICSKEENVKEQVNQLMPHCTVLVTDVKSFTEALKMIVTVGEITNTKSKALVLVKDIKAAFNEIKINSKKINCLYCIWYNPYMFAAGDTFISSMLQKAGFVNMLKNNTRYPTLSINEIKKLKPAYILLSTEPFPFKQKHVTELQKHLPNSKILLVDGEMFSWYGSRMLDAASYFKAVIN